MHARFAIAAMIGGAHVLIEKPLCVSREECEQVVSAAVRHSRVVGVNHNVSFDSTFGRLVECIGARHLGAIENVTVSWNVPFGGNSYASALYREHGPGAVM